MCQSRGLCQLGSAVLATAEARGGTITSGGRPGCRAGGSLVKRVAVVGAVGGHAGDDALGLAQQVRHLRRIVGLPVGQQVRRDLAGVGVHGHVQLQPAPACPAVLGRFHSP